MNNILITGAAGFIGYNLCKSFVNKEDTTILGVDSLNDAYDNNLKKIRLKDLEKHKNFTFQNINLSDEIALKSISNLKFDTIFHLAARAGVRQSFRDPKKYISDNTISTANISNFVKSNDINKLIIASTSSIYGDSGVTPMKEGTDEKYPPPSVYATSKLSGELMAKTILDGTDTVIQIPRFFTVSERSL